MIHALFGGVQSEATHHSCYYVNVNSVNHLYSCSLEALDQSVICSNVTSLCDGPWMSELKELNIHIKDTNQAPIEILFGADVAGKLFSGQRHVLKCGLVAMQTKLGWTILGKVKQPVSTDSMTTSMTVTMFNSSVSDLWSLDVLGISDPNDQQSVKEKAELIIERFTSTLSRDKEGRYEVNMPWIVGHPPLINNFEIAKARLDVLMKKLKVDGYYSEYNKVLEEWLAEDIIEKVPLSEIDKKAAYYLPHRHVVKLSSATTKLRPVFDASAKSRNHPSLNQCIDKGVNLLALIPNILLGFRCSRIGVISDIRKAFLQISLHETERDFLRFIWYSENGDMIFFRHSRVVFGINCSPFLLEAVINYHLQYIQEEGRYSTSIVEKLKNSFYVENCVTSVDTENELKQFIIDSTKIMNEAKFDLRCWEHSVLSGEYHSDIKLTPVLGLLWDKQADTLGICFDAFKDLNTDCITKKLILSVTNRVFDPIGFTSPVLLCPKLILQKTWIIKLDWNSEVPDDIKLDFLRWMHELNVLANIRIPRWFMCENNGASRKLSLHVFCDASQVAYASVIFLKTEAENNVSIQLVQAKSRVAPVKKLSIPRLELLAATIGVRLLESVKQCFTESDPSVYFWSDSTTVLSWIKRTEIWKPFVWNRIQEIKNLTNADSWFHVPGVLNPADLPSRGCTATQLLNSCWWEGPQWLYKDQTQWPLQEYLINEETVLEERRKVTTTLFSGPINDFSRFYAYFSKYKKIVRLVGWIQRFVHNALHPQHKTENELSVVEFNEAEKCLLRGVQQEFFHNKEERIISLVPFRDNKNIIRIKTKIIEREDSEEFRCPILLPSAKHPVVHHLIYETHVNHCHVGVQGLLSLLRERFWIIGGRKSVKSVINKCVKCRKIDARSFESAPVALPEDRVKNAAIFEVVGVDLFGPIKIRRNDKVWVVIFTCAVYRAVHLEIVSSLSTDSFIQGFRRFVARRGRPSVIYSDNGTNFVGVENALTSLNWEEISLTFQNVERIIWKFNPPSAPWWGGWWERMIGLIKKLLRKVIWKTSLSYEEMSAILCDCEAVFNSRPLTFVSEDPYDLIPLTPAMFLQEIKSCNIPDLDHLDKVSFVRRFKYRSKLRETLKARFRKEYSSQLLIRGKKNVQKIPRIGDIVLVEETGLKQEDWILAKIVKLYPGRDGKTRLVDVRTNFGKMLRTIQSLHPLEVNSEDEIVTLNNLLLNSKEKPESKRTLETRQTRSGRRIQPPQKLNL